MPLVLDGAVAGWLRRLGVLRESDAAPYGDSVALAREAAAEFENGVRVGILLQQLGGRRPGALKKLTTPVAKLYNWNLLLPELREYGVYVDADMKVLIVAGDTDIVVDVVKQLHVHAHSPGPQGGAAARGDRSDRGAAEASAGIGTRPAAPTEARSPEEFLAICLHTQLHSCSWGEALQMVGEPSLRRLSRKLAHGERGDHETVVRYLKLSFAHCRHLVALCSASEANAERALALLQPGLSSTEANVALWTSRLLCRIASELTQRGGQAVLWLWFSRPDGGASAMIEAWRTHPELHSAGSLLPMVLHFSGDNVEQFISHVLPQLLAEPTPYLTFALELLPLLSATAGMPSYIRYSGALQYLVQRALHVARLPYAPPLGRGRALELLAQLWSSFPDELQTIRLEASADAVAAATAEDRASQDAASVVLTELKRGCRDSNFELQMGVHVALFRLLDRFASTNHPAAPALFKALAFSLIENHHEAAARHFIARNFQLTLMQQPQIPVGVLLKPLIKQVTLYGYDNSDFDFFLTLAKHPSLGLRHALLLLQFLGKVCLNDALHGRVGSIPFLVLVERYHTSEMLHEFLEIFCEQALSKLLPTEPGGKSAVDGSSIRATLCVELTAKLLHLQHTEIINRVAPAVLAASQQHLQLRGAEHPGLAALLGFAEKHQSQSSPPPQKQGKTAPALRPRSDAVDNVDAVATGRKKALPPISPARSPKAGGATKAEAAPQKSPARARRASIGGEAADGPVLLPKPASKGTERGRQRGGSYAAVKGGGYGRPSPGRRDPGSDTEAAAAKPKPTEEQRRKLREDRAKQSGGKKYAAKLVDGKAAATEAQRPPRKQAANGARADRAKKQAADAGKKEPPRPAPKLSPVEQKRAALEKKLNAAADPNEVLVPAGLAVKVERKETQVRVVPPEMGLSASAAASLELMDSIFENALGINILKPVAAEETRLKVVPEKHPAKSSLERKAPLQPAEVPGMSSANMPPNETLMKRAAVRKKLEEEERVRKEKERNAKLARRRKEVHAKLLDYQELKQKKEEEKESKAAAALASKKEEEAREKARIKRRQEKNKEKLMQYRKSTSSTGGSSSNTLGGTPKPAAAVEEADTANAAKAPPAVEGSTGLQDAPASGSEPTEAATTRPNPEPAEAADDSPAPEPERDPEPAPEAEPGGEAAEGQAIAADSPMAGDESRQGS